MKNKFKGILFILILGSVCVSLLLIMRSYTQPKIKRYQEFRLKSNILDAAGIDYSVSNLDALFLKTIREMRNKDLVYYLSPDNLYIFRFEGRGLWGMITGITTLRRDLETIEGIRIISQEETPGLGGRISEEDFLSQFKGKRFSPELTLALRKKAVGINEVDAITGASMTSQALIRMLNEHVLNLRQQLKED